MNRAKLVAPRISVCGPGAPSSNSAVEELAEEVGRLIAEAGAVLICGGRGGVMEAACRGALAAGGLTVGILPGNDAAEANPYVSLPIPTGLGEARNLAVVAAGQAVIAIAGEYGTLSEIALALKLGRPVISLGTWQLAHPSGAKVPLLSAATPEEAVRLALQAIAAVD